MTGVKGGRWRAALLGSAAICTVTSTAIAQSRDQGEAASVAPATATSSEIALEQIVVTATRIDRAGFQAPTPLTVVSAADLAQGQRSNVGAALNDLPQFRATTTPSVLSTSIDSGTQSADLRGLGTSRTLVLLDGHRFIGDFDLNSVPLALVKRVDILTGGASAAWGSGAVSGVVNVILDDELEGGTLSGQYGSSTRGDGDEYRVSGAYGMGFDDDRGHLMFAGEYVDNNGIAPKTARSYVARNAVFSNPTFTPTNGQHRFTILPDVNATNMNPGGVIVSGVLRGQTFNPDGSLRPFQSGPLVSGTLEQGGEGPSNSDFAPLSPPLRRFNLSTAGDYKIGDHVRLSANLLFSRVEAHYGFYPDSDRGNITIRNDNAFLSDTIKQQMAATGETSFLLGRFNQDYGLIDLDYRRDTISATIGANGDIGDTWRWDAYYSHGISDRDRTLGNLRITANYAQAIDSVLNPTPGQPPICRVALTDPSTSCVPINLFGEGSPSQAALDYVLGAQSENDRQLLDVGGVSMSGEPFSVPAGPVSIAFGIEARRESLKASVSPNATAKSFTLINFSALSGDFSVKEAFAEVLAPIVKDAGFIKAIDLNGAGRTSDYSTSGSTPSWKAGLTADLAGGIRLRGVRSRDIRSANLTELFTSSVPDFASLFDPVKNVQVTVPTFGGGNPNLVPELADTSTFGAVFSPAAVPGLNLSVDYYDIDIARAITTISGQDVVTRCGAGGNSICSQVVRDSNGNLTSVFSTYVNLTNYKTSGFDVEVSYVLPLANIIDAASGTLSFRVLGTNTQSLSINDGISTVNYLGNLGQTSTLGTPKWKGVVIIGYHGTDLNVDVRARYTGSGTFDRNMDISNNAISARTMIDISADYRLPIWETSPITLFASVTNLFDKDPPILANPIQFDVVGRYFTAGVKTKF